MLSGKFQQLSSGVELMCNVSHSGGKTTYKIHNIPDFTDTKTPKLEFSWIAADRAVQDYSANCTSIDGICLKLCSGYMMCTVTQDVGQTTYTIAGLQHGSHCTSTWSNESDFVIANHRGQFVEPVMSSNVSTLVTSKCIRNVAFSGTCMHEGTAQDYTASCIASCAPGALIGDEGNSWFIPVIIVLLLLLLACLLGCLCYKYKIWRKCGCRQTGGFYNPVKFQADNQPV